MKKLANDTIDWLTDYAKKSGRSAWVVGVSGGVDSALVSTLCAMTGLPTYCVTIPIHSSPDGLQRADTHILWLKKNYANVFYRNVDLSQTFAAFTVALPGNVYNGAAKDLALANAKSRLRMIALYQVATIVGGLVVGTGNKVEDFGIGFFTKYGDGGVDISPIANYLKSEVRAVSRVLGVLPELCEAVPTDGLWKDSRTDEQQIGATYDELEWAMQWLEDGKDCYSTVLVEGLTERQKEILTIYNQLHKMTAHKMAPIPTFKR